MIHVTDTRRRERYIRGMDTTTNHGNTEDTMEYVSFASRNWSFRGDKGTWAAFDGDTLKVKRARHGIISSAYEVELREFCAKHGIDFASVRCGEMATIAV